MKTLNCEPGEDLSGQKDLAVLFKHSFQLMEITGVEDQFHSLEAYLSHSLFSRLERVLTRDICGIKSTASFTLSGLHDPFLNSFKGDIGGVRT